MATVSYDLSLHFLRGESVVQLQQGTLGVSIHVPVVPAFHTPALMFLLFSVSFSCDGQIQFLGCFRQVREANDGRKFIIDFLRFPNNLCTITSFLPIFLLSTDLSLLLFHLSVSRLWFPALLFLMSSTLLALIFRSSLFSLTRADPRFVLASRSFLISFLSFNSLLSSLQIWLPSCLAASSPSYLIAQGKTTCAAWSSGGKQSRFMYKRLPEFLGFKWGFKWKWISLLENTHNQRNTVIIWKVPFYEFKLKYVMCRLFAAYYSNILIQFSASYSYQCYFKGWFSRYKLWKEN